MAKVSIASIRDEVDAWSWGTREGRAPLRPTRLEDRGGEDQAITTNKDTRVRIQLDT